MYKHLLVPIDGTPLAGAVIEQAVAYARVVGARLTFLHVRPDIVATGDGALLHAMSPQSFDAAAAGNARLLVAKAEAAARAAGVPAASVVVTSDRPHEAILDVARNAGCDLVFMASHGRRGLKGAMLGSVTRKVLAEATLPVLVSAVESNLAPRTDEQQALAVLRDEHRSLAAVMQALLDIVRDPARAADTALLGALVYYIERFPERQHHPKEDAYLFRLLRARTHEYDTVLSELEQQHVDGAVHFESLRRNLDSGDRDSFRQAVEAFAEHQRRHMSLEERVVLPAASLHLTAEDWKEIATAFAPSGDPRFGIGESFEALASQLLELAAEPRT
jgi:nucleotide-binding universal stress UspA family protein/hemerythrin-like domain-containing protein